MSEFEVVPISKGRTYIRRDKEGDKILGEYLKRDGTIGDATKGPLNLYYYDTPEDAQAALDKFNGKQRKLYIVMKDGRPVLYSHTPLEIVEINGV